jgi:hypothetical protein
MGDPRTLPLLDLNAQPQSWNERMSLSEFAVLNTGAAGADGVDASVCKVFGSLEEAEQFAREQVALHPQLRCRIYDHHGFGSQPVREVRGAEHKGESEISARFRRWGGMLLFFGGLLLMVVDWVAGFAYSWPAMLGARMAPVGLVLLLTELVIVIESRRKDRRNELGSA